ncbi:unnamed protein product [Closterium sp. NIES-54]
MVVPEDRRMVARGAPVARGAGGNRLVQWESSDNSEVVEGPAVEVAAGAAAEPATAATAATCAAAAATAAAETTAVAAAVATMTWQARTGGGGGAVVNGWVELRAVGNGVGRSGGARSGLMRWNAAECGSGACGRGSVRLDAVGSDGGQFSVVGSGEERYRAVECGSPGTDPVTSGGAGSWGGATGSLESAAAVGARGERVGAAAAGATAVGGAAAAALAGAAAAAAAAAAATSSSCLWSSDPRSPLSFSSLPPPLLSPSRRSPRARPSSPVPFTDLRTALFCSSPPCLSPSVLPSPPESDLTDSLSTPVTDYYHTYRPVLSRVLASLVTDPRSSLSSVSALTAAVTEFASTRCLDYTTSLVAAPPTNPLAVGGDSALGCDALEDRQFELEFLAAASPHLCAMLLAPEGDPDALDIQTPRTYAEAVSGPWPSQWRAAMDSEMASYRSTGTYVNEFPPLGANVVAGI